MKRTKTKIFFERNKLYFCEFTRVSKNKIELTKINTPKKDVHGFYCSKKFHLELDVSDRKYLIYDPYDEFNLRIYLPKKNTKVKQYFSIDYIEQIQFMELFEENRQLINYETM